MDQINMQMNIEKKQTVNIDLLLFILSHNW
jgi:hypothetical protein